MQTSYIKAVEAAAEAIKAVEDVNARAEVVRSEIAIASHLLEQARGVEKASADEQIAMIQRQDHARRKMLGELIEKFEAIAKAIEGKEDAFKPEGPLPPAEIEPLKEAAE